KSESGHGKTLVKVDGKNYTFLNSKCGRAHLLRRKPRKVRWTILYRRKHKKSQEEETNKKRTRRTQQFQRAIAGASLNGIMAKSNQGSEVRKARREQAIRAAKEQKESQKATEKAAAPPKPKAAPEQKAAKNVAKAAPRVGGKNYFKILNKSSTYWFSFPAARNRTGCLLARVDLLQPEE
ncbi:60S ribosomal protein L24-like, partial [Harmonia axyridis]|uniref:60S ribosomal protein L24-like n=1 Tax=Harmonia axyridis TaxID=115357 RepID=UPI001E2778CE